jgi:hypothetical protein
LLNAVFIEFHPAKNRSSLRDLVKDKRTGGFFARFHLAGNRSSLRDLAFVKCIVIRFHPAKKQVPTAGFIDFNEST